MQMNRAPVVIALQPPHVGEELGFDLVVLGCLHDRLERCFSGGGQGRPPKASARTVVSES
jgi:hypothetical protein